MNNSASRSMTVNDDRMSIGAVLPMAPAAENAHHNHNLSYENESYNGGVNHNQGYFPPFQSESKMDSFTISVSNSVSNVSISVQTPSGIRPSGYGTPQSHSLVTISHPHNTDATAFGGHNEQDTFGRASASTISSTHQTMPQSFYNPAQSQGQNHPPMSLYAELSAATQSSVDPSNNKSIISSTASPASLSVQIEAASGHKLSIFNTASAPVGISHQQHSPYQESEISSPQPYNPQQQSTSTIQSPQVPQTPSEFSSSKRNSIYSTTSSKYESVSQRAVSTTTATNTVVGSPNPGSSSRVGKIATSRNAATPNSATSPNTAVNSSLSRQSVASPAATSISDPKTVKRSSGNAKSHLSSTTTKRISDTNSTSAAGSTGNNSTLTRRTNPTNSSTASTSTTKTSSTAATKPWRTSGGATSSGANQFVSSSTTYPSNSRAGNSAEKSRPASSRASVRTTPVSKPNKLPLTPEACLFGYKDLLTVYEQREIFDYPDVYYLGAPGVLKVGSPARRAGGTERSTDEIFNDGYDDSRGDYYLTTRDHIGYRYEIVSLLGKGSFGQVAKCFDHKDKRHVALKIIRNKKRFEKQGVVEVKVLDRMRKEDNENKFHTVHMLDHFYFRGHLCITFEMLGINLYEWLKAGGFRGVHLGVIRVFTLQMLKCLELMQRNRIIHCDLKPENILLRDTSIVQPSYRDSNHHSSYHRSGHDYGKSSPTPNYYGPPGFDPNSPQYEIKVIDFGSSCFEHEKVYTYVQSRFYRSPEVILGLSYTIGIDMWSLGAILAELFTGYPLFPGENEQEQLACIMELKGVPPKDFIDRGTRKKLFFDINGVPRILPNSKGKKRRPGTKSIQSVLRCHDPLFINFIERCLTWDPMKRMTPSEALMHDWITGINDTPQQVLRSSLSSRNSLNPSPTAASSRGSRLSGASSNGSNAVVTSTNTSSGVFSTYRRKNSEGSSSATTANATSKTGTSASTGTTVRSTASSTAATSKSTSNMKTIERTPTKETDGSSTSKSRSSSFGSNKSSSSTSALAATLKTASQFTAGVVKSIRGGAGRISGGANRQKTPNGSKNAVAVVSPSTSAQELEKKVIKSVVSGSAPGQESVSSSSPQDIKLPPVFPTQHQRLSQTQTIQSSSSMSHRSSVAASPALSINVQHQQVFHQPYANFVPSPAGTSPANKRQTTLLTTNIPITITGGGIVNVHNPNGTTTTFLPGQQLPSVNIPPANYTVSSSSPSSQMVAAAAAKRASNQGSPYYASPTNAIGKRMSGSPTLSGLPPIRGTGITTPSEGGTLPRSTLSRGNSISRAASAAKRLSQSFSNFIGSSPPPDEVTTTAINPKGEVNTIKESDIQHKKQKSASEGVISRRTTVVQETKKNRASGWFS